LPAGPTVRGFDQARSGLRTNQTVDDRVVFGVAMDYERDEGRSEGRACHGRVGNGFTGTPAPKSEGKFVGAVRPGALLAVMLHHGYDGIQPIDQTGPLGKGSRVEHTPD
jgi:hypothetical protein